jgi:FMN-dependent oxidoreductase (nitrilotriacetate monooxygenase family)
MANSKKQLRLGLFVQPIGHHVSGWRLTQQLGSPTDIDWLIRIAKKAEEATFDLFFIGDSLSTGVHRLPSTTARFEPLTLLSAIAVSTKYIGLAGTSSTTFSDPFTLARAYSSLDHISHGRAAWNVVTSYYDEVARNFSLEAIPNHADRYNKATEFLQVTRKLWQGWQQGAVVADRQTGQYFADDKINAINHQGKHFQVQGPLNITRSPQGSPVIIQAGSSEDGQKLAAATAEVVFTAASTLEEGQQFYQSLKQKVLQAARENLTLRELAAIAVGSRGHRVIVGTAQDIADDFQQWLEQEGADGFNLMPAIIPEQLDLIA